MMREELLKIVLLDAGQAVPGVQKPLAKDHVKAPKNVVHDGSCAPEIANGMYKEPIESMAKEFRYDETNVSHYGK
jgi:hypothetical protein